MLFGRRKPKRLAERAHQRFLQGDFDGAERDVLELIDLDRSKLGVLHPEMVANWSNLSRLQQAKGDDDASINSAMNACVVAVTGGADELTTGQAHLALALVQRLREAPSKVLRSLDAAERHFGDHVPELAEALIGATRGAVLFDLAESERALPELKQAQQLLGRHGPEFERDLAIVRANLGFVQFDLGNDVEGERELKLALELFAQQKPGFDEGIEPVLQMLGLLYLETGRSQELDHVQQTMRTRGLTADPKSWVRPPQLERLTFSDRPIVVSANTHGAGNQREASMAPSVSALLDGRYLWFHRPGFLEVTDMFENRMLTRLRTSIPFVDLVPGRNESVLGIDPSMVLYEIDVSCAPVTVGNFVGQPIALAITEQCMGLGFENGPFWDLQIVSMSGNEPDYEIFVVQRFDEPISAVAGLYGDTFIVGFESGRLLVQQAGSPAAWCDPHEHRIVDVVVADDGTFVAVDPSGYITKWNRQARRLGRCQLQLDAEVEATSVAWSAKVGIVVGLSNGRIAVLSDFADEAIDGGVGKDPIRALHALDNGCFAVCFDTFHGQTDVRPLLEG